jgi:hypothetical protein
MAPPTQDPPQPVSPTLIDQKLQEKAWALLLYLVTDLKFFKNLRAASMLCDGRPIFNPLKPDQPAIFTSQQATSAIQATVPQPQDGTIQEASILRSRIPASHKGKQIQGEEGIHGGHQTNSFVEPHASVSVTSDRAPLASQPESSSSCHREHQKSFIISEEGWETTKATHKHREVDR